MSKHIRLSQYEKPNSDPKIITSCVVSISNYCWFEKNKDRSPVLARCEDQDFDISFKLSSTAFATTRNGPDEYHFDKNGVKLTYNQCYLLFRSEKFTVEYIEKVKKYFERDLNLKSESQPVYENSTDYDDEEIEIDNEVYNPPPQRSSQHKVGSLKNSVIKRLRTL